MVKIMEDFPGVHATFNFVPLLAEQIEEYASGNFRSRGLILRLRGPKRSAADQKREMRSSALFR